MVAGSILQDAPPPALDSRLQFFEQARWRLRLFDALTLTVDPVGTTVKVRTVDGTIDASGNSGAAPVINTFYYVYWSLSAGALALSLVAPTQAATGLWYLSGFPDDDPTWLLVGWCQTIDGGAGVVNFADSITQRLVASYFNRQRAALFNCPGYVDNNARSNLAALTNAVFGPINAGNKDYVEFISNGEDANEFTAEYVVNAALTALLKVGIGRNSTTSPVETALLPSLSLANSSIAVRSVVLNAVGYVKASQLACTGGAAATFVADDVRTGAAADPACTYLAGSVSV